jgi:hypothetical protein
VRRAAALLPLLALSCVQPARWTAADDPTPDLARILLETDQPERLIVLSGPTEVPEIPVRERLRPCCAFGSDLRVSAGFLPIPAYRVPNVIGPEDLGPHTYDAGLVHRRREGDREFGIGRENNGLVYTCRAGFIDTAHVRDYLDWAAFFAVRIGKALLRASPEQIELPDEGGARRVRVQTPPQIVASDPVLAARAAGQWVAFQLSIWHELATWYGWQSVAGFPEEASAFSPEDLYSNLLGVKLAGALLHRRSLRSEPLFNQGASEWTAQAFVALQATPREVGIDAIHALDGVWWNSRARLPDKNLLLRRNFEIGDPLEPWRVPASLAPESLRKACGDVEPLPLANPEAQAGIPFASWLTFEIDVDAEILAQPSFPALGRAVTQADFPALVAAARAQNRTEAGPDADHP